MAAINWNNNRWGNILKPTITLNPAEMISRNDVFAFKFNRKSKSHLSALASGCIKFTRQDKDGAVHVLTHCPDDNFTLERFDGDYDDASSRTKTYFITNRKDGESIILSLQDEFDQQLESNSIFISYLGNDRFIVFAEQPFEFVNKTYTPPTYDATSLELPDRIVAEADIIAYKVRNNQLGTLSVNDCRGITYELDTIISGTATNQLRQKAIKLKRTLESAIVKIGKRHGKNRLAQQFKDIRSTALIEELKAFIITHHGHDALDKIERQSLQKANEKFSNEFDNAEDVFSYESGTEHQIKAIQKKLSDSPVSDVAHSFVQESMPPKIPLSRCSECNSKVRLNIMPQIARGKKKHEVKCPTCNNRVEGGRIGAEAVYAWNLANDKKQTYRDIKEFGISLLSPELAQSRVEDLRKYQSLKSTEIALRMKVASKKEMQELKKLKGKNTVLLLLVNYLSELLKREV